MGVNIGGAVGVVGEVVGDGEGEPGLGVEVFVAIVFGPFPLHATAKAVSAARERIRIGSRHAPRLFLGCCG